MLLWACFEFFFLGPPGPGFLLIFPLVAAWEFVDMGEGKRKGGYRHARMDR